MKMPRIVTVYGMENYTISEIKDTLHFRIQ